MGDERTLEQSQYPEDPHGYLGEGEAAQPGDDRVPRLVLACLALVAALLSFFVLGVRFSQPEAYANTIASLDAKKDTVMNLVGASTGSSAAITLLPGDVATPIAEKLIDLSGDFMIVLAAIYLEKYLLTVLGFVSFKLLVPVSCVLFIAAMALRRGQPLRSTLMGLAAKLFLFGLAVVCVVPASVWVSGMIERTYEASIAETLAAAEQTEAQLETLAQEEQVTTATPTDQPSGFLETLTQLPETITQSVTGTVTGLTEDAQRSLNSFIEALAVMVVTSCIIPVLVLLFFLWLVRILLGINIDVPSSALVPRSLGGRHRLR